MHHRQNQQQEHLFFGCIFFSSRLHFFLIYTGLFVTKHSLKTPSLCLNLLILYSGAV